MANECIDLSAVQNFAAKDANRIVGQIAKVLARKSPYMNVLKGGTIPNVSADATSELMMRKDTPESEGAEAEAKAEVEEVADNEIFEYKLKILKLS